MSYFLYPPSAHRKNYKPIITHFLQCMVKPVLRTVPTIITAHIFCACLVARDAFSSREPVPVVFLVTWSWNEGLLLVPYKLSGEWAFPVTFAVSHTFQSYERLPHALGFILGAACGSVVLLLAARVFDYFVVPEIAFMDNQAQITETTSRLDSEKVSSW